MLKCEPTYVLNKLRPCASLISLRRIKMECTCVLAPLKTVATTKGSSTRYYNMYDIGYYKTSSLKNSILKNFFVFGAIWRMLLTENSWRRTERLFLMNIFNSFIIHISNPWKRFKFLDSPPCCITTTPDRIPQISSKWSPRSLVRKRIIRRSEEDVDPSILHNPCCFLFCYLHFEILR